MIKNRTIFFLKKHKTIYKLEKATKKILGDVILIFGNTRQLMIEIEISTVTRIKV